MISLIMAGGKGTRMNTKQEKLLLEYKKPVIMHVVDALKNSNCFSRIIAATSSNSPETEKTLRQSGVEIISTSGKDFVSDLNFVLRQLDDSVFITSGDLPLLDDKIIPTNFPNGGIQANSRSLASEPQNSSSFPLKIASTTGCSG